MYFLARAFLVSMLGCLGLANPCSANDQPVAWSCWLDSDKLEAVCTVAVTPRPGDHRLLPPSGAARSPAQYLHLIRERPADLRGSQVYVPLFTLPEDTSRVVELVTSVLCGHNPHCVARYEHDMASLFDHDPELFVDMNAVLWEGLPV